MDRRPDALGDLRVLSDELLSDILERLSPRDLARLSCVSSVMYILCNEEPLWFSLCLRDGGPLEYRGSWKKTTLHRQGLVNAFQMCREKPLQFYGFNSLFLYRRWYRCFTTLDAFNFDVGLLERRKDLTLDEFHSQYDGKKPVLLTELAEEWPARKKWTKDQLLLSYGDVAFRISQRSSRKITMKFKDYVSYMELQHDEDPLYVFDDKFGEVAPTLLDDYSVPHLFKEDLFNVLDHDQRPSFRWLIIGPERSGASWHVDPALTSAWNTLLVGRKRWALYPPGRVPLGVTVHVNEEDGDVNIDTPTSLQWWLDVYPNLADQDKPLECTQLPGETIFVPSGWWHCVLNIETTIAVTQNFVNTSNFEYACLDMAPGYRHKGVCRAGLLAVEYDALSDANLKDYPGMTQKGKRLKILDADEESFRSNSSWNTTNGLPQVCKSLQPEDFSYDIDFLSKFLEKHKDHYSSNWSPSNCIGPRELRQWLHKLWVSRPEMRQLIWKGACLALNVNKWSTYLMEICASHSLPSPLNVEMFPVGTGSNPVFLISDYVVKIYVEGGLECAVHGLGTELEFYSSLHKTGSPLINHVPNIVASGLLVDQNGLYKTIPWDGLGVPDVIAHCILLDGDCGEGSFPFGIWSKKQFELKTQGPIQYSNIWPYIVTKRCKGDIFANVRDALSRNEILHLASFLGEQLRNLHLLPLPPLRDGNPSKANIVSPARTSNGIFDGSDKLPLPENVSLEVLPKDFSISPDWKLVIATLDRRKKNLKDRLAQWGGPTPGFLIEKIEEYIPHDLRLLLNLSEDVDGLYKVFGSPTWIHSDIMDDNVHMEPCKPTQCLNGTVSGENGTANGTLFVFNAEASLRNWLPTHILDFSNLGIGDPLLDLIPIHLDIFRGDMDLLKRLLESYRLPLASKLDNAVSYGPIESWKKFKRPSYRAMCFCILHEENILGAIFSLWKELREAKSWEEVEEAVWGELNNYRCL